MSDFLIKSDLPDGWMWMPLMEAFEFLRTGMGEFKGERSYYSTGSIKDKLITEEGKYSFNSRPSRANRMGCLGDVLQARMANTDKPLVINEDLDGSLFSTGFIQLRPLVKSHEATLYLYYLLKSSLFLKQRDHYASGSTQVALTDGGAKNIIVPVAPFEQQKRIVDKIEELFSHIDAGIEALNKAKQLLKQYRQSVLKAAVTGELTNEWREANKDKLEPASQLLERILVERRQKWEEQQIEQFKAKGKMPKNEKWKERYKERLEPEWVNLGELPEGWSWITIDQLASDEPRSIQSGPFGSNLKHSEFQETGKLVVGIDNVREGFFSMGSENRISEKKFVELEKYAARPGDVLITVMATIGRTCVIPEDLEPAIITKHVYRITVDRDLVLPDYLNMCLYGAPSVVDQIFGQTIGQTRPGLNGSIIKSLCIPIPSIQEQKLIMESVTTKSDDIERLDNQLELLAKKGEVNKQAVLIVAFSGNLVEAEPADEDASVLLNKIRLASKEAVTKKKAVKKTPSKSRAEYMSNFLQVLIDHADWISAKDVFKQCGISNDAKIEEVEKIYSELRELVVGDTPKVDVERRGDEDWFRIKEAKRG